jgi:hypothetical protein
VVTNFALRDKDSLVPLYRRSKWRGSGIGDVHGEDNNIRSLDESPKSGLPQRVA